MRRPAASRARRLRNHKARYSHEYVITDDQLAWLGARVAALLAVVEQASRERLATLEQAA